MGAEEYAFAAGLGWGISLGLAAALAVALLLRPRVFTPRPPREGSLQLPLPHDVEVEEFPFGRRVA
jgi:hypothetical protein